MLPATLSALEYLAFNLWWSWDQEATELWSYIDPWRWDRCRHNPVALLKDVENERWEELSRDRAFLDCLRRVNTRFQDYLSDPGWCAEAAPAVRKGGVAYFSLEFGVHESLRIYSGGLGVLAGDHVRSASDMGIPLVGVGLLYRQGYFRQVFDDFVQVPSYPQAVFPRLPVRRCRDADGNPITVPVPIADRTVRAQLWVVNVGRTQLYLLDTDHDGNNESDRQLTFQLYGGDQVTRIAQEVLLGIGGVRALRAMGLHPSVYHLNEGHCAFVGLELMLERRASGDTDQEALSWIRERCVFTTHTPVAAGHDRFPWDTVDGVLGRWRHAQHLDAGYFMDLGRVNRWDLGEPLCMTVMALRFAGRSNGVSRLHGEVSRDMWRHMYPGKAVDDVPIGHITNGVHPFFWMAPQARAVFDAHLPGWRERPWDEDVWARVEEIPDEVLWKLRTDLRMRLIDSVREHTGKDLDPTALTLGFARRFAPYKRGDLIFRNMDRITEFFENTPAQIVFAGKAHPNDTHGKEIVARVLRWATHRRLRNRVAFIEDYDITVGRMLTSGADVWLNNPRRPKEASGTSGQKVVLNGGLNLSTLDGWWAEAYTGDNGWAIGEIRSYEDEPSHDHADADSLYAILDHEVAPSWQERDDRGIPTQWLARMRASIKSCAPRFNSHRMVRDYTLDAYEPLIKAHSR